MLYASVVAVRAAVRAGLAAGNDGTLDPRQGRKRKMAHPQDHIRSFIGQNSLAYPLDHPFLKVKAECFVSQKFDAH